ncbi:MAG: SH3 domain-containing protein [Magnetovibrionaceae bacterium]
MKHLKSLACFMKGTLVRPVPRGGVLWAGVLLGALFLFAELGGAAQAEEKAAAPELVDFLDGKIKPQRGPYLVLTDVNVRSLPRTNSRRLSGLKRGSRVMVAGVATNAWYGVENDNGDPLGFVYAPGLMPLLDGTLKESLAGKTALPGKGECKWALAFAGRSPMNDKGATAADYDISFDCRRASKRYRFDGLMFMTEVPYKMDSTPEFQISMDIHALGTDFESVPSVTTVFKLNDAKVAYDGATVAELAGKPDRSSKPAKTVPEALTAAVEIALQAWKPAAWTRLGSDAD